ncbi:MAG TPA: GIY-YIG nuclease family protein [Candidatus Eisenbacteria bacterium]|nr:GIY-YIG nuclease family protein [Candidatus Eisenbacteria bacterium]
MNRKSYFVYILTNRYNTVFYTGVTSNLQKRLFEHKSKLVEGFTKKYNIWKLIYFEEYSDILLAIEREKQVKDYRREKKLTFIKGLNKDLSEIDID